jgi:hypothetical protein
MKYFPDMSEADRRTVLLMLVNVTWNDEDEAPASPIAPAKSETACIAEIMTTMCASEAPASVPADDDSSGIWLEAAQGTGRMA